MFNFNSHLSDHSCNTSNSYYRRHTVRSMNVLDGRESMVVLNSANAEGFFNTKSWPQTVYRPTVLSVRTPLTMILAYVPVS